MLTVTSNSSKVNPDLRMRLARRMMDFQALCTNGYSGQFSESGRGVQ